MEALLAQFSLLSDEALEDKTFDPARIETLMELFEQEAYWSWTSMAAEAHKAAADTELSLQEAEIYLDSLLESSMEDFRDFEKKADTSARSDLDELLRDAHAAKKMSELIDKAATTFAEKYIDAAVSSATDSMKSAAPKVHPA